LEQWQASGSEAELLLYVDKQGEQAEEVVVVYEAGPLGYGLYRALEARGVKCLVCAPDSTQQQRKRRKNNQIDARTLTSNLFDYLNGNGLLGYVLGGRLPLRQFTNQADHLHVCYRVSVPKLVKRVCFC
jgi:hypothetical protein